MTKKQRKELEQQKIAELGFNKFAKREKKAKEKKKQALPDLYVDMRAQRNNSSFDDDLTKKTCVHYEEAVIEEKLGWFWICPNGGDCQYRHAFPEGYTVEKKKKVADVDTRTLEEIIEDKRKNVDRSGTKITLESFNKWKTAKRAAEAEEKRKEESDRKKKVKSGKVKQTGREWFMSTNNFVEEEDEDGDDAFDLSAMKREKDDEENMYDIEAANKANELANSDKTLVMEKNEKLVILTSGSKITIDPSLYQLNDETVPELSELE
eukprot:TRINITY_DN217_c0_g1_i3.p1 TRINITY_DN217_c0_g1~~TRINITY_DN217_c0_g1_i3.p1  ORF type:complete len:265 (-),score=101.29 TRINITY_DN217_c0_g1_i3:110-904(-)